MNTKLHIELFKFNHKKDYLPYYKHYEIEYTDVQTIDDMLHMIDAIESLGYEKNCNLRINRQFINSSRLIIDVVSKLGKKLKIESICEYRATDDLKILNTDFVDKIKLFTAFLNKDEIESYIDLYELQYYVSNTINYNRDYIGDHALLIAYDIIKNKPYYTNEVLDILANGEDGIYQYTSSKNRIFDYDSSVEKKVEFLFDLVLEHTKSALAKNKFFANLCKYPTILNQQGSIDEQGVCQIKQNFKNFNIAYYDGLKPSLELKNNILNSEAKLVEIEMCNEDLPVLGFEQNKKVLYKICADILLQAKDNNADFLILKDEHLLNIFDKEQKKISKIVGREIDLVVISQNQFTQLLGGEKNKEVLGFNNHTVKIEFLESA